MGPFQMFLLYSSALFSRFVSSQHAMSVEVMRNNILWMECKVKIKIINECYVTIFYSLTAFGSSQEITQQQDLFMWK